MQYEYAVEEPSISSVKEIKKSSAGMVILTVFWDSQRQILQQKRFAQDVHLLHDSAYPHSAARNKEIG
jgi:uncharacterized protein YdaU (DUF1376 family)